MALGDSKEPINHEEVLQVAEESRPRFVRLIREIVKRMA
jgi:purine nucleoside phosphorylase